MPKPRKHERVQCAYFHWTIFPRENGIWYADGRGNRPHPGRHSLGVAQRSEAPQALRELDEQRAIELGLAQPREGNASRPRPLLLADGRRLYEEHYSRPIIVGGVDKNTKKSYRQALDAFGRFAAERRIETWQQITEESLASFAADLDDRYAPKTVHRFLITLKQAAKYLREKGHLAGAKPINLHVKRPESQPAYCYRVEEVRAMIEHCRGRPKLEWLANVIVGLACTGLRIGELAQLRWSDFENDVTRLRVVDESGYAGRGDKRKVKNRRSRILNVKDEFRAVLLTIQRVDSYVYHGPRGGRLKPDTVRNVLIRDVIGPLKARFSAQDGERGFVDGRLHSFRHYFCSRCHNEGVPERVVMAWLGHQDSAMVRHYYHLHDAESKRWMDQVDFVGGGQNNPTSVGA